MIVFANAKVNLGLFITEKRTDGYHTIETVFLPIVLSDILEVIRNDNIKEKITFSYSGIPVKGIENDNLCIKAYRILDLDFNLPSVRAHLHKAIPVGAGLGGGSSDAAGMLVILNKIFNLNLTHDQLVNYALQLGSDCPFFLLNSPAFATGRGEILEPLDFSMSKQYIVLINPGIHVGTKEAYSMITPEKARCDLRFAVNQPLEVWKNFIFNDFEKPVFNRYPVISEIKNLLYFSGAVYASMSGSGSTVFGIFREKPEIRSEVLLKYKIWEGWFNYRQ